MTSPLLPAGAAGERAYHEPLFAELDAPVYFGAPQTLPGDNQKWWMWLMRRPEQTGSSCAQKIGMCAYPGSSPHQQWRYACGVDANVFNGNDATRYGECYEDRVRCVAQRVLRTCDPEPDLDYGDADDTGPVPRMPTADLQITEYGLFRGRAFGWMGISPDGITNAVRLRGHQPHWDVAHQQWALHAFDVVAGKAMFEVKCSPNNEYVHVQVGHLPQVMMQMYVTRRRWTVMQYWSRDRTRQFLVQFSSDFWRWMELRMILFHEHVVRRVPLFKLDKRTFQPIEGSNPLFNWLIRPERGAVWGNKLGDYCKDVWFSRAKAAYRVNQMRAPITLAQWDRALKRLGMTHEQYIVNPEYARHAPVVTVDATTGERRMRPSVAMLMVPPRPPMYEIFRFARDIPGAEQDLMQPPEWIRPVDPSDRAFFDREYPHISEYYDYQIGQFAERTPPDAPLRPPWIDDAPTDADLIMDRAFVQSVCRVPALDEPEPLDESDAYPVDPARAAAAKARYDEHAARMAPPPAQPPPFMLRRRRPIVAPTPLPETAPCAGKRTRDPDSDDAPPAPPLRTRWLAHLQRLTLPSEGKSLVVITKTMRVPLLVVGVDINVALPAECADCIDDYARMAGLSDGRRVSIHYNHRLVDMPAMVADLPWCANMEWLLAADDDVAELNALL
jgi:hypothetical protein